MLDNFDEQMMQRALQLAQFGLGNVSPNPLVGAVITFENKIIGEAWHQKFGENHAEVNAVLSVKNQDLLSKSTIYVSLEPCSHFGKTPPCADLLIEKKFKRVVIANQDPNPKVAGRGVEKLKNAGIEVKTEVLKKEGYFLNRRFFTFFKKKRPYVILKWAETQDGFIARENFDSKWISNRLSRTLVHRWRAEEDAILVGTNTAKYDNPKLNVRLWKGKNPLRIVLDKDLILPQDLKLFNNSTPTICYSERDKKSDKEKLQFIKLNSIKNLESILNDLCKKNIQSLIVEGGAAVLNSFIKQNLWDEARIFKSPQMFGKGISSPKLQGKSIFFTKIGEDLLNIIKP